MPMRLNIGLSKKHGLPNYGSIGASCHVELELESSLLQNDLETFHRHVRSAYVACHQAVHDELARQQANGPPPSDVHAHQAGTDAADDRPPQRREAGAATTASHGNGGSGGGNGGGHTPSRASTKQMEYLQKLATQVPGLGVRRLDELARQMSGKPLADLTVGDASRLIDTLKSVKAGEIELDAILSGEAP